MKRLSTPLIVSLATLSVVGIVASVWLLDLSKEAPSEARIPPVSLKSKRQYSDGTALLVVPSQKGRLTQSDAVALAEKFIAQNGYTDLPPDKTKLSYETIEWESSVNLMLQERHDTLERRAYGVRPGRKGGEPGWTVAFYYKGHPGATGRAVTMNLDGGEPRVEHVEVNLRYVKKL